MIMVHKLSNTTTIYNNGTSHPLGSSCCFVLKWVVSSFHWPGLAAIYQRTPELPFSINANRFTVNEDKYLQNFVLGCVDCGTRWNVRYQFSNNQIKPTSKFKNRKLIFRSSVCGSLGIVFIHISSSDMIGSTGVVFLSLLQCESKKSPLRFSDIFSQTVGNFLKQFLHTYYTLLSMLDYKTLFSYL